MNIFPIHKNPETCCQLMCDQHIVKILTEAVEVYCSSLSGNPIYDNISQEQKYKNIKSPWVQWAKNYVNRYWLAYYIYHLNKEYEYRFNKKHKAFIVFKHVSNIMKEFPYRDINLTFPNTFLQLVDDNSKCEDSIKAYRNYYKFKYNNFKVPMRWTKRQKPKFLS